MQYDRRELQPVEQPTEELTLDDLEQEQIVQLPEREAISVVNGSLALPIGTAASAGLLSSG